MSDVSLATYLPGITMAPMSSTRTSVPTMTAPRVAAFLISDCFASGRTATAPSPVQLRPDHGYSGYGGGFYAENSGPEMGQDEACVSEGLQLCRRPAALGTDGQG